MLLHGFSFGRTTWSPVLEALDELPLAEFDGRLHMLFAVLRAGGRPYQVIAGDGFTDADRAWLLQRLPHATITTWRGTGHFPHLAHPQAFAEHLAATATTPRVGHEPDPEDSARVELGRSRATTSRWSDSAGSQATPRPCVMS